MAEGESIKKRLRNANPNTLQPDQALSSSKKKCNRYQEQVKSECVTKQEKTPQRRSLRNQGSGRLSADQCTDASLVSQKHDDGNSSPQTIVKEPHASLAEESKISEALSPKKQLKKSPRSRSQSWRRSSFKGGKGRKSLPPIQRDVTEICEDISLDLPGDERLAELFRVCLEYTLQKLQHTLGPQEGFGLHAFQTDASAISNDVKRIVEAMKLDGTLRKCTEEPEDVPPTPETEMLMKQLKNDISRLNAECEAWDQLLEVYRQNADRAANELEQAKVTGWTLEPTPVMENSQMDVITSKPDYQSILDKDVLTLQSMECIMDQLQQTMSLITRARQEWDSCLQHISKELASQAFEGLEEHPLQKFLMTTKE
ncbi:kinetochore-associated protein DSN1 homolog [Pristis pectinata]|uniref:kinetochore-associated protein DSN1 homolog n=1 Tax=Pristis pectinata TaxID=685728 RepID=UPI00223E33AC|nr:kinetochore-associated protein DSN1 homolog [Pristis pectinata]